MEHACFLRGFARSLVGRDGADDLVQETWLRLYRSRPRDGVPVGPWLVRVARNLSTNELRRQSTRRRARLELDSPPDPESILARAETERQLVRLVARLREPYLTTILLRYGEGLTSAQIAARMRVPSGTVRWRLKHAVGLLRREMA